MYKYSVLVIIIRNEISFFNYFLCEEEARALRPLLHPPLCTNFTFTKSFKYMYITLPHGFFANIFCSSSMLFIKILRCPI